MHNILIKSNHADDRSICICIYTWRFAFPKWETGIFFLYSTIFSLRDSVFQWSSDSRYVYTNNKYIWEHFTFDYFSHWFFGFIASQSMPINKQNHKWNAVCVVNSVEIHSHIICILTTLTCISFYIYFCYYLCAAWCIQCDMCRTCFCYNRFKEKC